MKTINLIIECPYDEKTGEISLSFLAEQLNEMKPSCVPQDTFIKIQEVRN